LLAQAVLDKKVSLDDDIRKYLVGDYPNLSYRGTPITLQHLANHTSRLPVLPEDITEKPGYNPLVPESHYDSLSFFQALRKVSLDTIPGFKFNYSNWGMALLGHILEHVYTESYETLVNRFITGPLKMRNTSFPTAESMDIIAVPHSENGKVVPVPQKDYFSPAGGLCSTAEDMVRYLDFQITEHSNAVKLTHTPTRNSMGLGWGVRKKDAWRDIQHNGSTQGSSSHISLFPELHSGCVVLTNCKANLGSLIANIHAIIKDRTTDAIVK
jgi:CubicO group peptidase (beta-lactamase class C family)